MSMSYFFSHDFNASEDVKMLFLREQLGMEGVGIYWFIIERLAQAGGKLPVKIIPVLSMQMHITAEKTRRVIEDFELFEIDGDAFLSKRLVRTMAEFIDKAQKQSEGGKKGMANRWHKNGSSEKPMIL